MDLHKIVFDEINEEFWGIPSGTRRRGEPAPGAFATACEALRSTAHRLVLLFRKARARSESPAAPAGALLRLVRSQSRHAGEHLDRAA